MHKEIVQRVYTDLAKHPTTLVLSSGWNKFKNRHVRYVTAIAPWHHESYFTDEYWDSYDGLLRDGDWDATDDGKPSGSLGGNNDYLCAINSEEFEVMAAIGEAFAGIGESAESFDLFWSNPQGFLRDHGVEKSYKRSYRIEARHN